jgi:DNA-binding helix-hairpin-helix protein with protein kinase domain
MTEMFVGGERCLLGEPVGYGAVSQVYALGPDRVAKIYREPDPARTRRLERMLAAFQASQFVQTNTGHPICVWPETLISDSEGTVLGYAMRRISDKPLSTLFEHRARLTEFPDKDWKFLLTVANNLAQTVRILHDYEIVIGDLAPSNVYVTPTGLVSLLDCDSLQFSHDGEVFPCETLTLDYSAPQLVAAGAGPKSSATDRYSLAILVCQLLLVGEHPFQGFPTRALDAEPSPETNIMYGVTALTDPGAVDLPDGSISIDVLPERVRLLARQTFGAGHADPDRRPAAEEWYAALDEAWDQVRVCGRSQGHTYSDGLGECPWCSRARRGLFDPFPALEEVDAGDGATPPVAATSPLPGAVPTVTRPPAAGRGTVTYVAWAALALVVLLVIILTIAH